MWHSGVSPNSRARLLKTTRVRLHMARRRATLPRSCGRVALPIGGRVDGRDGGASAAGHYRRYGARQRSGGAPVAQPAAALALRTTIMAKVSFP